MTIIGIDPGNSGGIAIFKSDIFTPATFKLDKLTETDIADVLRSAHTLETFCYIEKVGANRQRAQGERAQGASTMFAFGQAYGFLRGVLITLGIPFEEVLPQKWQGAFSLGRTDKAESTTDKKNRHKAKAQQLWPSVKVTHGIADALLIAEYGRRLRFKV